jgi:hypothetical protein
MLGYVGEPFGNCRSRWEGTDWIHLAQNRDQWRAVVNTVMNLQVTQKVGNFVTEWLLASQELCYMDLAS